MSTKERYAFEPDYAVLPGDTLREVMEYLGMSQRDFASRLDTTPQTLNRIFKGEQAITPDMANKLERVTETSAMFWNNLETQYRAQLVKEKEFEKFQKERDWLEKFPIKDLIKRNYIAKNLDFNMLFDSVLSFFGVSSPEAWERIWKAPSVASRRSPCFDFSPYYTAAWIRMGEKAAQKMNYGATNIESFKKILPDIKKLTNENPDIFIPELKSLCASCGVAFILVPEFKGLTWSGATWWIKNTAVIMLNLRGKAEDKFWFSFFHEASHVIYDSKFDLLINDGSQDDPREVRANEYAKKILFGKKLDRIRSAKNSHDLVSIAKELGISPGIVAGQYQFLTGKYTHHHGLIRRFEWE